ncbi:hypothetical protein EON65_17745 [archaeon]|nr:MAG: hypothetical protein EON65_17745 [archaeon]
MASFNHVSREVLSLEKSKRFYIDILGFHEIPRPPFDCDGKIQMQAYCTYIFQRTPYIHQISYTIHHTLYIIQLQAAGSWAMV